MAVAITRTELSAQELRAEARRTKDTYQARRLLALALVLDGASRTAAGRAACMDRQTLRDWVHRYNAEGAEGLCDRARSGRPPRVSEAQLAELAQLFEAGPDPARHGVVRWRCLDLRAEIKARFEVEISERHVGRLLKRLGFTRLSVRPRHPQADEAAQQAFKPGTLRAGDENVRSRPWCVTSCRPASQLGYNWHSRMYSSPFTGHPLSFRIVSDLQILVKKPYFRERNSIYFLECEYRTVSFNL